MELRAIVRPTAGRWDIKIVEEAKLRIKVTAAPQNGKANNAVIGLLFESLWIPNKGYVLLQATNVMTSLWISRELPEWR